IASTPLIVNGVIYIGSFDKKFYALDVATGDVKWVFDEASNWFWADALYENGIVYACSLDNNVYAIDASSGELTSAWSSPFDAGSEIKSSPVITGDVLVVASEEGEIYGIDLQNGQEKWNIDLEIKVLAPLCASGDTVYVNAQDNRLYAIDGLIGRQDWSVTLVE
ncbi:MAG: PQQ-binding-like beta-propeller repeat protein, partial [Dehalococcoidia bacterium]|nr:PQQ-binding-like beta-propeller repeat protein [Dehalococcoidia bacterium]